MIDGSRDASASVANWLQQLQREGGRFAALLSATNGHGYRHTIREICQQPPTWTDTACKLREVRSVIAQSLAGCQHIVLTGSGSSQYAGECAAGAIQNNLRIRVDVSGGGDLLLSGRAAIAGEPTLVVSLARSGESPESAAVVETLLAKETNTRHLVLTCNSDGKLAKAFSHHDRVRTVDLGPQVNDRSLVMTSSFTNLVLGASFLGWTERADEFLRTAERLDCAGRAILARWPDRLAQWVRRGTRRFVFLGTGSRLGACHEGALKLLEMTGGRVATLAETYLGLRHGPMCFIDDRTLVVCLLSTDPLIRSYEQDLIRELNAKGLGAGKLIAGLGDPGAGLCHGEDLAIAYDMPQDTPDDDLTILDAMIAQILGFHRCLEEGLAPDSPSNNGAISRVVRPFQIYPAEAVAG